MTTIVKAERIGSTIAEGVADRLRNEIRAGTIRPGEFLRQNTVASRLGVSSTPVREALALLEREGLVRREPHRGVAVFKPTIEDLLACYEIREALEVLAARKAALAVTKQDLDWLDNLADEMPRAVDHAEYLRMNRIFHERIEIAAGSPRLFDLIAAQRIAATTYIAFLGLETSVHGETAEEHHDIVKALASRNASAAGKAMSHHLRARAEVLRTRLSAAMEARKDAASPVRSRTAVASKSESVPSRSKSAKPRSRPLRRR